MGVNYVQSAEGYLSAKWSIGYYKEKCDETGDDMDALMAVENQYHAFELLFPVSLPLSDVDMDTPTTEEVIYDTDFEPVTIVDDEGVTAVIHDYYVDEESGISLVISIENRTGSMLRLNLQGSVDGNLASVNSSQRLPTGKTLIEPVSYYVWDVDDIAELASANTLHLSFALLDENHVVYGNYLKELDLDISPYGDATSSVHGTAAWVADPTPQETPQPTEEPAEEDALSADTESAELVWIPDPETDAVVTLGDSGEYLIGALNDEKTFPEIVVYFGNNSDTPINWIRAVDISINGESVDYGWGVLSPNTSDRPGGDADYIVDLASPPPSDGFEMQLDLVFIGGDSTDVLETVLNVTFAEDGSATIEQIS